MPIQISITDEKREDLLATALEGGSNYWYYFGADASDIYEQYGNYDTPAATRMWLAIKDGKSIPIRDLEHEEDFSNEDNSVILGHISMESIEKGEQLLYDQYPFHFADIIKDNEDATTGDVWFQFAVMGELVF